MNNEKTILNESIKQCSDLIQKNINSLSHECTELLNDIEMKYNSLNSLYSNSKKEIEKLKKIKTAECILDNLGYLLAKLYNYFSNQTQICPEIYWKFLLKGLENINIQPIYEYKENDKNILVRSDGIENVSIDKEFSLDKMGFIIDNETIIKAEFIKTSQRKITVEQSYENKKDFFIRHNKLKRSYSMQIKNEEMINFFIKKLFIPLPIDAKFIINKFYLGNGEECYYFAVTYDKKLKKYYLNLYEKNEKEIAKYCLSKEETN